MNVPMNSPRTTVSSCRILDVVGERSALFGEEGHDEVAESGRMGSFFSYDMIMVVKGGLYETVDEL
jgi:hypothetical protein